MAPLIIVASDYGDYLPCHCIRCDAELPELHSPDHICDKCFDTALQDLLAHLISEGLVDDDTVAF